MLWKIEPFGFIIKFLIQFLENRAQEKLYSFGDAEFKNAEVSKENYWTSWKKKIIDPIDHFFCFQFKVEQHEKCNASSNNW